MASISQNTPGENPPEPHHGNKTWRRFTSGRGPARMQIVVWILQAAAAIATIWGVVNGIQAL
jgi:hypothetical protein